MKQQHYHHEQQQDYISTLPDDILLRIGWTVAKLCDIEDFVSLSLASKRFQRLLMDSKESVAKVICIRTANDDNEQDDTEKRWLPSFTLRPICIKTLEQLTLYERAKGCNLLRENRLCQSPNLTMENRVNFEYSDLQSFDNNNNDDDDYACMTLIGAIRSVLSKHPTACVILDSHCGATVPDKVAELYSEVRAKVMVEAIVSNTNPVLADQRIRRGLPTSKVVTRS